MQQRTKIRSRFLQTPAGLWTAILLILLGAQVVPAQAATEVIYSVDAGSDAELSDPLMTGAAECLDPGDGYSSLSTASCAPNGVVDDAAMFVAGDPFPANLISTGIPFGACGTIPDCFQDYFDMDGIDLIKVTLQDLGIDPNQAVQVHMEGAQLKVVLFSADHEATNGLRPGFIYQKYMSSPSHAVALKGTVHMGLTAGADVDAFEIAFITDPNDGIQYLGVLFSVDEDDPTTAVDESGGLNPGYLFGSFLDGGAPIVISRLLSVDGVTGRDLDAIAATKDLLNLTDDNPNGGDPM